MDDIPTELQLVIVKHLAHAPRPEVHRGILQVPSYTQLASNLEDTPLKALSSTNKQWRKLTSPSLFTRLVIRMRREGQRNLSSSTLFRNAMKEVAARLSELPKCIATKKDNRGGLVESLTLEIDPSVSAGPQAMRNPAKHSTDIITMHDFWRRLFDVLDPAALAIIAPVEILGWLTTTVPDMRDAWTFGDMRIQKLELTRDVGRRLGVRPSDQINTAWDTEYLFNARPWKSIALREGSMLQAYGQYEYFHRNPPTILAGLCLPRSECLESFSLHCLFPFNTHLDELQLLSLSHYKQLHFHFSPAPNMEILDDAKVLGMADLVDCWREIEQIYQRILQQASLFGHDSRVCEFSTGDYTIDSIRTMLDGGFEKLAEHGWESSGPGSWAKTRNKAPLRA
ncbi:Transmembrane protein 184 [Sphaceloma murrayae]|uniref:Transmembrane protein 184 n=1 Tax=Sphaceloma murrayae TaxID=2082308 RepID=A0A2K1QNI6_9PEZI|nr:Transmembrane protein 184 [Sphaceloma murrayae]